MAQDLAQDWYRLADQRPPYRVQVRVAWAARSFIAIRGRHPKTGHDVWAGWSGVQHYQLDLPGEPELWQPLHPEKWLLPLPAPVPVSGMRMVSERLRFGAVEEATSADLAAEMERDRQDARRGRLVDDETPVIASQWWRDISQIAYHPAGDVSQRHAEGRVMRALAWAGVGGGLTLASRTVGQVLAGLAEAAAMGADDRDRGVRFTPLPADHDDFLIAMSWFTALNPPERRTDPRPWSLTREQRILAMRARSVPLSFGDIGHAFGWKGHQRAQQVYGAALDKVWRAANGRRVFKASSVDQIAALQERNRAYRRAGV